MRLTRFAAAIAALVLALTGCGGDDDPEPTSDGASSERVAIDSDTDEGAADDEPARKRHPEQVCTALNGDEVAEVLGSEVRRSGNVENGCSFDATDDGTRTGVTVTYLSVGSAGGVEAVEQGIAAVTGQEPRDVSDVGAQAFVAVTDDPAGAQGIGAVLIGDSVVQLHVVPGPDTDADEAEDAAVAMLELVAESLGRG